ncbi:hypothetical protein HMP0721_0489 [Pseudoramibacter alactolyticus ATCC 23263]|uniref:Uncharacterized protein n=1 Tax=Pseudoramibacter alactolyticus ATCC 23263 TaxID=887929 RepID=E6MEQ6_9FIRM|nr:hypothetical protein HMP0721_0489 [Pseudoramibacter alactolyticus ATCC 23263]
MRLTVKPELLRSHIFFYFRVKMRKKIAVAKQKRVKKQDIKSF